MRSSGSQIEPGYERPGEDRQAAEQRRGALGEPPLARLVDRPDGPREAHRERRQQRRENGGGQEGVQRVELVGAHKPADSIAGAGVACARWAASCAPTSPPGTEARRARARAPHNAARTIPK